MVVLKLTEILPLKPHRNLEKISLSDNISVTFWPTSTF